MTEAAIVSIEERIRKSRKASAVERAWRVAKALESDRSQIEGLTWVEPKRVEGKGITRSIDFNSEFPDGIVPLMPIPINVNIVAPANILVPGGGLEIAWTMPILTRMGGALDISREIIEAIGYSSTEKPTTRNTIEVVSFLPFPKADAPEEEKFKPQFYVMVDVNGNHLEKLDNYFGAVVRHNGKVIKQFVNNTRTMIPIYANPYNQTLFNADMLISLSEEELLATPKNAGHLEIYVYRITQGGLDYKKRLDFSSIGAGGDLIDFPSANKYGGNRSLGFESPYRGGNSFRGLSSISGLGMEKKLTSPSEAEKEVGDVRIGEGDALGKVDASPLEGYVFDKPFGIQPIRIRLLGVREASQDVVRSALEDIATGYKK
ncbi:hypothetical protein HYU23_02820 [Candidatus Woesearchaeota archaeon]|nr:hypothetical protein [Candidatus Woesearchaeota archaeon]